MGSRIILLLFFTSGFIFAQQSAAGKDYLNAPLFIVSYSVFYDPLVEEFTEAKLREVIQKANGLLINCGITFVARDFTAIDNLKPLLIGTRKIFFVRQTGDTISSFHAIGSTLATTEKSHDFCQSGAISVRYAAFLLKPGHTLAHEILHTLSLDHVEVFGNLMHPAEHAENYRLTPEQCRQARGSYDEFGGLLIC